MLSLTLSGRIESSLRYSPFRQAGSVARDQAAEVPVQERDRGAATDETLIAWAAAGDRLAFDHLCTRQLPLLYGAALRVTGRPAEAEEVAQEAMLRAWRDAARFDPRKAKLSTWLYRIAVNLAIDRARRPGEYRGGVPLEEAWLQADPSPDPEAALAARQDRAAVAAALRELPPRQRAALALAYDRGLSGAEAAAALDVTQRALEGLLRRGRLFLLARLRRGKE